MAEKRPRIGPVERRIRAELRQAGWTADSVGPDASLAAQAVDLAATQDRTLAARDKATLNRELRMTMADFRAKKAPAKGDVVDEAADESPGGGAGAPDSAGEPHGNVRPFGRRRPEAG